jgi:endonuclease YncB( thermonuclease family)
MHFRRSMVPWTRRRHVRWHRTRGNTELWIAIAVAAGLGGYQLYQHWNAEPRSPIIGGARVIDGDTIDIAGTRIRLEGLDAPEFDQTCTDPKGWTWSCGRTAARELQAHIHGQRVSCENLGLDRYRRVLAVCALPDGSSMNAWLVRQGWAVASGLDYYAEQSEAQSARRGIWAGTFMPPWQWRQRHQRFEPPF